MNRRDLLQFFGIGTVVTPVLNGTPIIQASAELLTVPNVKMVDQYPCGHAPKHYAERLKWNPYEAIWLHSWQAENNPPWNINGGMGPLENVLQREPTEAEKAAVAGLIQWFGTNRGHSFIEETLRACGYRVEYDRDNPHTKAVKDLQYGNVWVKSAESVEIVRRGRTMTLRPGLPPEVKK